MRICFKTEMCIVAVNLMATDRDDEARSMHWSVMEWEKDKVS